jgi:hypothetical protein
VLFKTGVVNAALFPNNPVPLAFDHHEYPLGLPEAVSVVVALLFPQKLMFPETVGAASPLTVTVTGVFWAAHTPVAVLT